MHLEDGVAYQEMPKEEFLRDDSSISDEEYLNELKGIDFFQTTVEERKEIERELDLIHERNPYLDDDLDEIWHLMSLDTQILKKANKNVNEPMEWLDFVSKLNLRNLDSESLNIIKNEINKVKKVLKGKIFKLNNDFYIVMAELALFALFKNYVSIGLAFGFGILWIKDCFKEYKKYRKYKNLSKLLLANVETNIMLLNSRSEEPSLTEEKSPEETVGLESVLFQETPRYEDNDLLSRISAIESKILLLPNEEEASFHKRLHEALRLYQEELKKFKNDIGTELYLSDKPVYVYTLERTLDKIERDLDNKPLFINEDDFNKELDRKTNVYLENISSVSESEKWQVLSELRNSLLPLFSDDIIRNLSVADAFAKCFWETVKQCGRYGYDLTVGLSTTSFIDRVIIEGERILDNLEQTIDVVSARNKLYQMKNSDNYDKEEYLRQLVQTLNELGFNNNLTRRRKVTVRRIPNN
ncbi:MAG: hypothetical protein NC483_05545 [Ruminococcus sp.]|nr:hypothetical protein [Ruminococcus sp.]